MQKNKAVVLAEILEVLQKIIKKAEEFLSLLLFFNFFENQFFKTFSDNIAHPI